MRPLVLLAGLAVLSLGGCYTAPLNPASVAATGLADVPAMPVRAAPAVWNHTDDFKVTGMKFRNETGKSFASVFTGTKPEFPVIEIVSSTLTAEIKSAGFAADYVYAVTIRLTRGGRADELSATATYRAIGFTGPAKAAKLVTEDAIAQLAKQVRAIIQRTDNSF